MYSSWRLNAPIESIVNTQFVLIDGMIWRIFSTNDRREKNRNWIGYRTDTTIIIAIVSRIQFDNDSRKTSIARNHWLNISVDTNAQALFSIKIIFSEWKGNRIPNNEWKKRIRNKKFHRPFTIEWHAVVVSLLSNSMFITEKKKCLWKSEKRIETSRKPDEWFTWNLHRISFNIF